MKESDRLPKIHSFSLVLTTKDYNPEKYETLSRILCKQFARNGNPAHLLECYLSVVTRGLCNNEENGTFIVKEFDARQAYANVEIKSIIQSLGMEAILVYTALMLKKRVIVYHPKVDELLRFTRTLPCLVWHRQNWDILYPYVHLDDEELKSFESQRHYVVGCTDAAIETRTDLYDIFIAVPTHEVTVAPNAKDSLAMSKLHKDVAVTMVNSAANEELSDQQVIKEIAKKTKELLNNLKTLATPNEEGVGYITLEALRERKMQPATEHFLYNLAMCEGLVQL
ncbi:unnamed protein product [Owenia fusiformis]|uniref:Uncharacterized protein n=2 Tax=Owenia fusiformis TaxID=6347 RepID=A0A8J1T603_OWEFU|nr:unnamed protein product [Owenia fusiformis]